MGEADLAARLASFIAAQVDVRGTVEIGALARVRGGSSSQIWAFQARWRGAGGDEARDLVLRSGADNSFAAQDRADEFAVLRALEAHTPLTPRVFWRDLDGAAFGAPAMIMERRSGAAHRRLLARASAAEARALGEGLIDLMASVHAAPRAAFEGIAPHLGAASQVAFFDAEIRRVELEPMPELRLAAWRLMDMLPAQERVVLTHGDFRPANVLVEAGRITALLDWEFAHLGDPLADLGWYLTPYYEGEHLVPGVWGEADVIARYEARASVRVDAGALRFWKLFAMFRLAAMRLAALAWAAQGDTSRMIASADALIAPLLRFISEETAS